MLNLATLAVLLAGTFACITHDNQGPDYRFTSVNAPYGAWLRARTSFPAQNGQPAQTSEAFVGFDPNLKRWNIVVIGDDGSYYTRSSTSAQLNGSRWKDRDPADGGQAEITIPNPHRYVFDFRQALKAGKTEHSRTVCTKTTR